MYFDKLCTIYKTTYTKVGGVPNRKYTRIYNDIPCNFKKAKENLRNTEIANNADLPKYIVVLPIQYNLLREGYKILLTDPDLGSMGEYIIGTVQADRSLSGAIDCITFPVQSMQGQI